MLDESPLLGILSVTSPPDGVPPAPPVVTRLQCLPFGDLTWENFERLCHRLVALEGDVEHCARYGRPGDAQEGIDVYARKASGLYHCLQAKRHKAFSAAQIREAVDLFLGGQWAQRADRFTIAVQSSLRSKLVQDEIEAQAARLAEKDIVFVARDGEDLTTDLRPHPEIVDDFFGRPWVQMVLGDEVATGLKARLDGSAFAKVRAQLGRVYESHFQFVDPGSFGSITDWEGRPELTLLERFQKPDMLVREAASAIDRSSGTARYEPGSATDSAGQPRPAGLNASLATPRMRRLELREWLGDSRHLVVLGDAGSGKSTLLRVIALDLLRDQKLFPELAEPLGRHLPVYIPFARWTAQAALAGGTVGIKDIVRRSLEHLLTVSLADLIDQAIDDGRVLLLIDGLDEWGSEQAARTTLSTLVTTVQTHAIPAIVSGRPRGLEKIGTLPTTWRRGTVAPLSASQQLGIASCWFSRFTSEQVAANEVSNGTLRASRFMADLAREPNLAALATTPLLLIGLVTLALRGQILPRTRGDVYDQLVRVLLEVHPVNRATAAGDTEERFRHATDPGQRRAAISCLAYAIRLEAGGGSMAHSAARDTLRAYLASPSGHALDNATAAKAADEILSVNSETQGLIVEKGPEEVGFVHASFEEYLGAEHIGSWAFDDIAAFVRAHAGEARWRNVITNLLGGLKRANEIDRLVAIIEESCADELPQLNRQMLLGDIAFAVSARAAVTSKRLALDAMHRVEAGDWMPSRREALSSILKGLGDPTLKQEIEKRLTRWLPARQTWRRSLIEVLGTWEQTPALRGILYRAMHDQDSYAQRAAAKAYAQVFSQSGEAFHQLIEGLARSRDCLASAAMLEGLARGWPSEPAAVALFQEAWASQCGELQLVGAFGLATGGASNPDFRALAFWAHRFWSSLSDSHREMAAEMLRTFWLNDPELIDGALKRVSRYGSSQWEYDAAHEYLLCCDLTRPEIRGWILKEFDVEHPFNFGSSRNEVWGLIGQLAAIDPEVRAAANRHWTNPENRIIGMYNLPRYVAHVADAETASVVLAVLAEPRHGYDRMWALEALLTGWEHEHSQFQPAINAVIASPDEKLEELVGVLPGLYADKSLARSWLLRMSQRPTVRRDLLTSGFVRCGCDASDDEAVAAILLHLEQGRSRNMPPQFFEVFGAHPAARSLARQCINEPDAELSWIAPGYANDLEFAPSFFDATIPLPAELRSQIVEVASEGASGTALEHVLSRAMFESDPELLVRMVRAHYERVSHDARSSAVEELLRHAVAIGPSHESVRAAALAGLTALGALDALACLKERNEPVRLSTGDALRIMPSLERQICERFSDFEAAFGADLAGRLDGRGSRFAEILTAAPNASPAASAAFMKLAEEGKLPESAEAVRALAAERPKSTLLLQHCWRVLERRQRDNTSATVNAEVALVLRAHFPDAVEVRQRLLMLHGQGRNAELSIGLAVYAPDAIELPLMAAKDIVPGDFGAWTIAMHVAAHRADSKSFCELLEAMVTRDIATKFDAQGVTNLAVQERLQRDSQLEALLGARLHPGTDPSVSGSFARYLAAAGKFDAEVRAQVSALLLAVAAEQRLPICGYDAIADKWRSTRATLLDALSAGLEFN